MAQQLEDVRGGERRARFVTARKAEQWWIDQARKYPHYFIWYVSGLEPAKHHLIWLANIFHPDNDRVNIIAPRDSAKTTILNYAMTWFMAKNPLRTNAIVSAASDQAEARLRMIRSTIMDNARFKNVFPHVTIDPHLPDTVNQFTLMRTDIAWQAWRTLVTQKGSLKDPTLKSAGTGSRTLVGSRFSGILMLDDIMDEKTLGDDNMDKLWRFLTEDLIPAVKEEAKVVSVSTRWQMGDICDRFEATGIYKTINIPAEIKDPKTNERRSYWEEYWPLTRLDKRRAEIGDRAYELMYMNNPMASTLQLFTEEQLNKDLPDPLPKFTNIYISTDQAASEAKRSDWNVYTAIGEDAEDNVYILDIMRFKATQEYQLGKLADFYLRTTSAWGKPKAILVEKVTLGLVFIQAALSGDDTRWLPFVAVPISGRKEQRIETAVAWAQRRKLFFNQGMFWAHQMKTEMLNMGTYKHDDIPDTISLFYQYRGYGPTAARLHVISSPFFL